MAGAMATGGAHERRMAKGRPSSYASVAMRARRKRILAAARCAIEDLGWHGCGMREIGIRADVATRTMYKIFGSREQLLVSAIEDLRDEAEHLFPSPTTLHANLARISATVDLFAGHRNCARALVDIYFGSTTPAELRQRIDQQARSCNQAWLRQLQRLRAGIAIADLADDLVRVELASLGGWLHGRMADDEIVRRMSQAWLGLVVSATRGDAHRSADALLRRVQTAAGWVGLQ